MASHVTRIKSISSEIFFIDKDTDDPFADHLTAEMLELSQQRGERKVRLRSSTNGEFYSFAGVGSKDNDWAIPCKAFEMKDILGHYLILLEPDTDGTLKPAKNEKGQTVRSEGRVQAFVEPGGEPKLYGKLDSVAHKDDIVDVYCSDRPLREWYYEKEAMDVSKAATPPTPSSCSSRSC